MKTKKQDTTTALREALVHPESTGKRAELIARLRDRRAYGMNMHGFDINLLTEAADMLEAHAHKTCAWAGQNDDDMPGTYQTACGELWTFVDGGPVENRVRFCHRCGQKIKVTP